MSHSRYIYTASSESLPAKLVEQRTQFEENTVRTVSVFTSSPTSEHSHLGNSQSLLRLQTLAPHRCRYLKNVPYHILLDFSTFKTDLVSLETFRGAEPWTSAGAPKNRLKNFDLIAGRRRSLVALTRGTKRILKIKFLR